MAKIISSIFLTGALIGTLGDYCHYVTATLNYPEGGMRVPILGQPIWVPFLFGFGTLSLVIGQIQMDRRFRKVSRVKSWTQTLLACICFFGLYAASGFVSPALGGLKSLIIYGGAFLIWMTFERTAFGLFQGLTAAFFGVAVEVTLIRSGAFYYLPSSVDFLGVPAWLPALYLGASVATGCLKSQCVASVVRA